MHACAARGNTTAGRLVLGFGLIILGLMFALRNLGAFPPFLQLHIFPLALLVLALACFARRGLLAFGGHVLLVGAVALQLKELGHIEWLRQWWPVGLIWLGLLKVAHSLYIQKRRRSCQDAGKRFS